MFFATKHFAVMISLQLLTRSNVEDGSIAGPEVAVPDGRLNRARHGHALAFPGHYVVGVAGQRWLCELNAF